MNNDKLTVTKVNISRLCSACETLCSKYSKESVAVEHRDAVRLRASVKILKDLIDEAYALDLHGYNDGELIAAQRKLEVLKRFVLERADMNKTVADHRESVIPNQNSLQQDKSSDSVTLTSKAVKKAADLHPIKGDTLVTDHSFPSSSNRKTKIGMRGIEDQLQRSRDEAESMKNELLGMVGLLKNSVLETSDQIQSDTSKLDVVQKEFEGNIEFLAKVSKRLNQSLNSSTLGWKPLLVGLISILMTWFFTYLVMRFFPKVKNST